MRQPSERISPLNVGEKFNDPAESRSFVEYMQTNPKAVLLGVKGGWYDVTSFIPHHPGGEWIAKLRGRDVTHMVAVFHDRDVLKGRKPVGYYTQPFEPATQVFEDLRVSLQEKGFFETDYVWYAVKMTIPFILLGVVGTILCHLNNRFAAREHAWSWSTIGELVVSGIVLGNFWQQCGFLMHDLMHNECFHNRKYDQLFGIFFGTICTGIGSFWWRDEHFEHHAFTNVYCEQNNYYDPQMREDVWIQNDILKPSYKRNNYWLDAVQLLLFRIQHLVWVPICVFFGRIAIIINAVVPERRWYELLCHFIHWIWVITALFNLLPLKAALVVYVTATIYEGVLHLQLLVSHYPKPWTDMVHVSGHVDWYRMQVECCLNIVNPWYTDWFHGGLNFHIEHHLFPTMPRHNFRKASKYVREACCKAGLVYDECTLLEALGKTITCLYNVGSRQTIDSDPSRQKDE